MATQPEWPPSRRGSQAGPAEARRAQAEPVELIALVTETARPEFARIDDSSAAELAALMAAEDAKVPQAVAACLPQITAAIDAIEGRMRQGGRLIYAGAGSAGRMGVADASECPPTFGTAPRQVTALIAGGPPALIRAVEGAEDDEHAGATDLEAAGICGQDAVVGISASGRTPYVLGAHRRARGGGALAVALSANPGSAVGRVADLAIEVITGPELVAGSTRLKAGTAQKLVLNMISTITMIRLGKTFGNLMVDVSATNAKLRARAHRIVSDVTGQDGPEVDAALTAAGGNAKRAILMLLTGAGPGEADAALAAANGHLRDAMARTGPGAPRRR